MQSPPPNFTDVARPLMHWVLGPDSSTRARTGGVGLAMLVYLLCCMAAWYAAKVGIMRPWAVPVLVLVSLPANALFLVLVRSGWTRGRADPGLMIPQNILGLTAIGFSYLAIVPQDRGAVFVLLALVIVFGMYTHTPRQSLIIGVVAILGLGLCVLILSQVAPEFYPFHRELLRFELLSSVLPLMVFTALQLARWRDRLHHQRTELSKALHTVQHLVTRDALTGLFNRRYMQECLEEGVVRQGRYGEGFTVALLDLDMFKHVNDQHGHRVGDQVLASFAGAAQAVIRDADVLGRWGGEEFIIVFPNVSPQDALRPLLRLQADLRSRVVSPGAPDLRITFSAGLCRHETSATLDQTLERADAALYEAKHAGRDQVALSSPVWTVPPTLVTVPETAAPPSTSRGADTLSTPQC